jgi:hypothetical protein
MKKELSNLKEVDQVIKEILHKVSPCCKAEFEEADGSVCCNARISESGLCYDCKEHTEMDGYFCEECNDWFESSVQI